MSVSSHVVNITIKVRDAGGMCQRAKGQGGARSGSQAGDGSGSPGPTGSGSQGQQHPHLSLFSPPAAARQAAPRALAIWPEEENPERNFKYSIQFFLP